MGTAKPKFCGIFQVESASHRRIMWTAKWFAEMRTVYGSGISYECYNWNLLMQKQQWVHYFYFVISKYGHAQCELGLLVFSKTKNIFILHLKISSSSISRLCRQSRANKIKRWIKYQLFDSHEINFGYKSHNWKLSKKNEFAVLLLRMFMLIGKNHVLISFQLCLLAQTLKPFTLRHTKNDIDLIVCSSRQQVASIFSPLPVDETF